MSAHDQRYRSEEISPGTEPNFQSDLLSRYRDEQPSEPLFESTPASADVYGSCRWHAEQLGGTYPAFVQGLAKLPYKSGLVKQ